jgi:serine protease Do
MIGVQVQPVPREALEDFGLKQRTGALVAVVSANGPAAKAGMEPGDIILEVNNRPIPSRDDLVQTVMSLTPGTTVPVTVLRDKQRKTLNVTIGEIDLDQETGQRAEAEGAAEDTTAGFGMSLGNLTTDRARRFGVPAGTTGALVMEVDPSGTAARAGLREGDVITQVNRRAVESATDASKELQQVKSGGTAMLLIWRQNSEVFLTVRKE